MPRGAAQELAAGRGEDVAADRVDVDRQLPDRLAGVEQERHAGGAGDAADRLGGVDEPALRRHVHERDELDASRRASHSSAAHVELAVLVVGHDLDRRRRSVARPARSAIQFEAYSARPVRIRSPGAKRNE